MALQADIQTKYNRATETFGQARAILDEYGDKPMPAEKQQEVDRLFDAFDGFVAEAKRLEKAREREQQLAEMNQPQNDLEAPKGMPGKPGEGSPSGGGDDTALYMKAWNRALRSGARALTAPEAKALRADSDPDGGFLVAPQQVVNQLIIALNDIVSMRRLGTVYRLDRAESLGVPVLDTDVSDPEWTSEVKTGSDDSVTGFEKRELKPAPLAKRIKVSKKLLRQSSINVDTLVRDRFAYKFGITEEKGFVTGSGTNQPLGVFTASPMGISTSRDITAAAAAAIAGDDLLNMRFGLKQQYWAKARWLLHRDVLKAVRKLKDSANNYVWSPGLGPGGGLLGGLPATLVDQPFEISEYALNTITTGRYTAVLGDFSYYWIAEAMQLEMQVLMELYAETNQVGYIGRMEVDGMPVLEEAFVRLKQA
jgi:HK97 family phage major capsid protein